MEKLFVCFLILVFLLSGCQMQPKPDESLPQVISTTALQSAEPTEADSTETTPEETKPEHSELYIPDLPVEDVITYFNEVCLDAEFVTSGDPSKLQRWEQPIRYIIYGEPTEEDLQYLHRFSQWLNTIVGFPGISETNSAVEANLRIHFCSPSELLNIMGNHYAGLDGAVAFWYDNDRIYDGVICCRTDLDQNLRNSVILEEVYNCLGPVQDSALREDSIIYAGFSQPQQLTAIDELLLRLLYDPAMQCGMNAEECQAVIRKLYY